MESQSLLPSPKQKKRSPPLLAMVSTALLLLGLGFYGGEYWGSHHRASGILASATTRPAPSGSHVFPTRTARPHRVWHTGSVAKTDWMMVYAKADRRVQSAFQIHPPVLSELIWFHRIPFVDMISVNSEYSTLQLIIINRFWFCCMHTICYHS